MKQKVVSFHLPSTDQFSRAVDTSMRARLGGLVRMCNLPLLIAIIVHHRVVRPIAQTSALVAV